MAQAINKKSGGGGTFTEQDEKVYFTILFLLTNMPSEMQIILVGTKEEFIFSKWNL